jgi:hypothetical protein
LDFGAYSHHAHHSHYLITNRPYLHCKHSAQSIDQIHEVSLFDLPNLVITNKQEVSLFHFLIEVSCLREFVEAVREHWKRISKGGIRGLMIAYLNKEINNEEIEKLIVAGINAFIV